MTNAREPRMIEGAHLKLSGRARPEIPDTIFKKCAAHHLAVIFVAQGSGMTRQTLGGRGSSGVLKIAGPAGRFDFLFEDGSSPIT